MLLRCVSALSRRWPVAVAAVTFAAAPVVAHAATEHDVGARRVAIQLNRYHRCYRAVGMHLPMATHSDTRDPMFRANHKALLVQTIDCVPACRDVSHAIRDLVLMRQMEVVVPGASHDDDAAYREEKQQLVVAAFGARYAADAEHYGEILAWRNAMRAGNDATLIHNISKGMPRKLAERAHRDKGDKIQLAYQTCIS